MAAPGPFAARPRKMLVAGATLIVCAGACAPNQSGEGGPAAADTARGVVAVVGAEPTTRVALRTADAQLLLVGDPVEALRLAAGIDVWVSGSREEDGSLRVETYRVRSADGVPATDGMLELEGDTAVILTAAGDRVRFSPAPAGLRRLAGRHVWIAAPPGGEPRSWGTLDTRR
jgi:hypothetical protein